MAYNGEKTREWSRNTPNDGELFNAEFNRIYENLEYLKETTNSHSMGMLDNAIINGDMRIAQRGTSFSPSAGLNVLDRFTITNNIGNKATITQDSDVPDNTPFQYSLKVDITSDHTIGSGDVYLLYQHVEGYNAYPLSRYDTMTFSFWMKSNKLGNLCIAIRNSGYDRCYVSELSVTSTDWQEYEIIIPTNWNGGTWNWTNGSGFRMDFVLLAGTDTHTATTDSWQSGGYVATTNQMNLFDTLGNRIWITGVKLNKGNVKIPFNPRPYGLEEMLCLRYYEHEKGFFSRNKIDAYMEGTNQLLFMERYYKVNKRVDSGLIYWDQIGNANKVTTITPWNGLVSNNVSVMNTEQNKYGFILYVQPGTSASGFSCNWRVDAEL